jgi:hypothetical protein
MQAERTILPEFDALGQDAIARPVRRARHRTVAEALGHGGDALFEHRAAGDRARLVRGPGADLALPRPRREIGVGLRRRDGLHRSLDTDLAEQRLPVEAQRRPGMRREVPSLAALGIGVEDEAALVDALQQHDAGRRPAILADRRQRHRMRVARLGLPGLVQPRLELGEGLLVLDVAHGNLV